MPYGTSLGFEFEFEKIEKNTKRIYEKNRLEVSMEKKVSRGTIRIEYKKRKIPENFYNLQEFCLFLVN